MRVPKTDDAFSAAKVGGDGAGEIRPQEMTKQDSTTRRCYTDSAGGESCVQSRYISSFSLARFRKRPPPSCLAGRPWTEEDR